MEGRRNGLTPIEVYSNLEEGQGLQGAEGDLKTWIIDQLVTGCEQSGVDLVVVVLVVANVVWQNQNDSCWD
jgi:hypothetical protein